MLGFAISGKAASGKSELGRLVSQALIGLGRKASCHAFADAIKEEVYEQHGILKTDVGGREALIRIGDEARLADARHWIDRLVPDVRDTLAAGAVPIVDDLRFPAELEWATKLGLYTIRVVAPLELRRKRLEAQGLDPAFAESDEMSENSLTAAGHDLTVLNAWDSRLAQIAFTLANGYLLTNRPRSVQ